MSDSSVSTPMSVPVDTASATTRTKIISGWVGALAAAALGIVHLVVNSWSYAGLDPRPPVGVFLAFGVGLTLLAWLIAAAAWRSTVRPIRGVIGVGAVVVVVLATAAFWLQVIALAVTNPALIVRPLGPGLWSAIAGPALLVHLIALGVERRRRKR